MLTVGLLFGIIWTPNEAQTKAKEGGLVVVTDSEKWDAVVQCDNAYDNVFFYGVKTTGIFCRPSCKSKIPRQDNVLFFATSEDAIEYGLRPCKRCRPDLIEYMPMVETIEKAKLAMDTYFADREALTMKMKQLGMNQNYLIKSFGQQVGFSPVQYTNKLRIEKSKQILHSSNENILHVALASGFGSLSTFYERFKKQVGVTPKEYRRNSHGQKA